MRLTAPSRRLAAAAHARQLLAHRRAEAAANAVTTMIEATWKALLGVIASPGTLAHAHHRARALLGTLWPNVHREIAETLTATGRWGYRTAISNVLRTVPVQWLRRLAMKRWREVRGHGTGLAESAPGCDGVGCGSRGVVLREEGSEDAAAFAFDFEDLLSLLRGATPADADLASLLTSLLFPPPDRSLLSRVIYGSNWTQRLAAGTSLAAPPLLANLIVQGLSQGLSQQEIARQLLSHVQGVQASARRIARTESMRVAGAMQLRCHEQLGDMVIGYTVHATLDQHTRPWHRQRDGTVYYQHPGPGQKSYHQMPHPPDEAADPGERPPGTPHTAWNCRCFLSPVLSDPD